ncbi:type II secretion system major pseudopilin GspG [bacterium]|nr:type II secretion system major pseudopilin GspG [bacterium]
MMWPSTSVHFRKGGFTLIEIMLVVIIIGILASMVIANFGGMSTEARNTRAQADLGQLRMQLGLFEQRYGHYPTEEEGGLMALLERPSSIDEADWRRFGDNEPVDPWGNTYIYLVGNRRINPDRDFNIYSLGPNGQDDGMAGDDVK